MAKDLTHGAVGRGLLTYTIPILLGNLLQLTYHATDAMIVGRYLGDSALAAVGISSPVLTLAILFIQGICLGSGILSAAMYGAKDEVRLRRQFSTVWIAGVAFSLFAAFLLFLCASPILKLLQVEETLFASAKLYLQAAVFGLPFTFLYQHNASTLRAMGDSRTPLYFLLIGSAWNIVFDFLSVAVFSWGIFGCALGTLTGDALSGLLCMLSIAWRVPSLMPRRGERLFDRALLATSLKYGIVSAMQQSTVQLGKLAVQGAVNTMGVSAPAAFHAVNRLDDYAIIPEQNIAHGMAGMMAQNRGAGKHDRVERVFRLGILWELIYGVSIGLLLYLFAPALMTLFSEKAETVALGISYLRILSLLYLFPAVTNGVQGYFRGMGQFTVTFFASLTNMVVRVLACLVFLFVLDLGFLSLPYSYLLGWCAMLLLELPYLIVFRKKQARRLTDGKNCATMKK